MIFQTQPHEINWTLRKWARYHLPHLSYPMLAQMVRKQEIKIDNRKTELTTILAQNNSISIKDELIRENVQKQSNTNHDLKHTIIFEDENYLIIDKPYGIASQGEIDSIAQIFNAYIIHRLDKTTTGIMIMAKNKLSADFLSQQLREHKIHKQYLGICMKNEKMRNSGMFQSKDEDKLTKTQYEIIKTDPNLDYTLIKFIPITGKKHQIRKHCELFNCAILGDTRYGGHKSDRVYLHSESITFQKNDELVTFHSKLNFAQKFEEIIEYRKKRFAEKSEQNIELKEQD